MIEQRCFELSAFTCSPSHILTNGIVFLLQNYEKRTEHNMSQLFSMLIKFYILTKLFYYFHEYYFVLQQNYKNETKTQHVTNYYLSHLLLSQTGETSKQSQWQRIYRE